MTVRPLIRDGLRLEGHDCGQGPAVVFQHGLGGDNAQVAEVFPENARRLTLECRGHGGSEAGARSGFSLTGFAGDVLSFVDQAGVAHFVAGGLSMGAALAMHLAVVAPQRVSALILARPAWLWHAAPPNMAPFGEVAEALRNGGRATFRASATARNLAIAAPDNLVSLERFFDRPDAATTAMLLSSIAADGPGIAESDVRAIRMPCLVIGTGQDLVHPLSHARTLARMIAGARLVEITPKAVDRRRHVLEFRAAVAAFLEAA